MLSNVTTVTLYLCTFRIKCDIIDSSSESAVIVLHSFKKELMNNETMNNESTVDDLYIPIKKQHKVVKTFNTGVGQRVKALLEEGQLTSKEIVELVNQENSLRKTTYACVAWYKNDMKKNK